MTVMILINSSGVSFGDAWLEAKPRCATRERGCDNGEVCVRVPRVCLVRPLYGIPKYNYDVNNYNKNMYTRKPV